MIYGKEELDIIVADGFKEINYRQKRLLLAALGSGAERQKYADELIKTVGEGVYNKIAARLTDDAYREKVISGLDKKGVECVTLKSSLYPERLKSIPVPPLVIYCKGNAELLKTKMFAVVGSRKTIPAVIAECKSFCEEIARHMTVVTGVADGADSAAASGALDGGNVICVLPGGHAAYSPPNRQLLKKVAENGLVISEFPPFVKVQRHTFILRNRIIAGLSEGVLVVSAAEKSGALSTASYAVDYSRDLFAIPYAPGVDSGKGCNNLIKNGAMLCDCVDDILSAYGINGGAQAVADLTEEERAALTALKENGAMHAEKLAKALNKNLTDVVTVCSMLEIKGLVVRSGGNVFSAV